MNVFTSAHQHRPFLWQITVLCVVLGFLLAASLQTVTSINRSGFVARVGFGGNGTAPVSSEQQHKQEREIARLQARSTELENALTGGSSKLKALNDELQRVKILAGLTPVKGPGVVITLQDSHQRTTPSRTLELPMGIIHDQDLLRVVQEIGQGGAEAIAINGQRMVGRTAVRCVGPTILVNNVPLVPPYVIAAIGDPDTLWGALNLPNGVLDELRKFDPTMFKLEKRSEIEIPAYTGSTEVRYVKPESPSDADKESKER